MNEKKVLTRRDFVQKSALGAAALTVPTVIPSRAFGAADRVTVAVLGVNGRGTNHIEGYGKLEGVEVVALCDPDLVVLGNRAGEFEKKYGRKVKQYQDLRKLYLDKSIDAVSIATPNHWHSLAAIWAMQAGKDVYVEKPGSHNIFEGRKMVEAAAKYDRIVQHGIQLRSSAAVQEAIKHLRDGLIGRVYMARGLVFRWRDDVGRKGPSPVPEGLDYDLWTGPAEMLPFSRDYVHYNWHWHWNYGNGDIGNQGTHETDLCMWGLDVGLPEVISAGGGKFVHDDAKVTPDVLSCQFMYPKERKMIEFEVRPWITNEENGVSVGNIFYGTEGYLVVYNYDRYESFLGRDKKPGPSRKAGGDHYANFIEAVRKHDKSVLNAPVETAHLSSALSHLGNIAYRTGRTLKFDPVKEKFIGDDEADRMLTRNYRNPYIVPEKV
ncbi:MAG TPA: Gfo/Idh/MocA family oxidoreductase [Bacteroidales bacterium]|nr:Gfo/Idh/MocA family oxidoreductase [Bacteroidales bacterium]HRR92535.1 Gfo/Idh/MocA family oxidoreductase [Bacteroidales bacterium]HRT88795.1 Gfo/Idh/MocA family oxidoreductase [Bacteroidales bacterium]